MRSILLICPHPEFKYQSKELSLTRSAIHIWKANLCQTEYLYKQLSKILSEHELDRANRFHFQRDKRRFIIARAILRILIGGYLGVEPQRLNIVYSKYGKPEIASANNRDILHFNLSHTEDMALYIFSKKQAVGIDAERVRYIAEWDQIAKQYMAFGEYKKFFALSPKSQRNTFFSLWVRREALLKATGIGFAYLPEALDISFQGTKATVESKCGKLVNNNSCWDIQEFIPERGYIASFAAEGEIKGMKFIKWEAKGI